MRAFLLLMVCSLMSVQGIRQPGESFMVWRGDRSVNVTEAEFATCMPTYQVVHFKNERTYQNSHIEYYPHCVRVKRCSGCCLNRLHTCQPNETELRNFSVWVSKYDVDKREWISGLRDIISLREDKSCKCACPVRKECGKNQKFDMGNCGCVCTNIDERRECLRDEKKYWDVEKCRCECKLLGIYSSATKIRNPEKCRCD